MKLAIPAVAVALAAAWGAFLALAHVNAEGTVLDRLESALLDLRFQLAGPRPAPEGVVIVAIDEDTVRHAGRHPLPREVVADLVSTIHRSGASALALDVLFLDRGSDAADG